MRRLVRVLLVIGLFGLVGPPVGGLVAWTIMGAPSLRSPLPFITGAYGEGGVIALLTGALCCIAALTLRTKSLLVPIAVAAVVTLSTLAVDAVTAPGGPTILQAIRGAAPIFIPPAVVAALVCWALSRRLLRGS